MKSKFTIPMTLLFILFGFSSLFGGETLLIGFHANNTNFSRSDLGISANRDRQLSVTTGQVIYATSGAGAEATPGGYVVYSAGWNNGSGTKGWVFPMTTSGYQNLTLTFYQRSRAQLVGTWEYGPRDFKLQYSTDGSSWIDVAGTNFVLTSSWQKFTATLPAACNNQAILYLRWVMRSNISINNGSIASGALSDFADFYMYGDEIPQPVTSISLSNSNLSPNTPIGTGVGVLTATDPNAGDTHSFALVAGIGDTHNSSFIIAGNILKVNSLLSAGTYSIRVNAFDGTFNYSKNFCIVVQGAVPADINLSNNIVLPSSAIGTTVGNLTAIDKDPYDSFTFSFISGEGDTHNSLFLISGKELKTNAILSEGTYSVRINVYDGTSNFSKNFSITCALVYPTIKGMDQTWDYITKVIFNSISNSTGKETNGYGDYLTTSTSLNKESTYSLTVSNPPANVIDPTYPEYIKAFIDWNQDGDFNDVNEGYEIAGNITTHNDFQINITVPSTALEGHTRLRIAIRANVESSFPASTGDIDYGEAEDYTINVTGALPVELTSFTAKANEGKILLNWATATEMNNYGFDIERKIDKIVSEWEKIGFVEGHGNSNSPKEYCFIDSNAPNGELQYRLKQIDFDGNYKHYTTIADVNFNFTSVNENQLPTEFELENNFPNPFNPSTLIKYSLPQSSHVILEVYSMLGEKVITLIHTDMNAGYHEIIFDGSSLTSGMYIYRLTANSLESRKQFVKSQKMLLVK